MKTETSRRHSIAAGAAAIRATACAAPVAMAGAPGASDVDALIDEHRNAHAAFEEVVPELDAIQDVWNDEPGFDIPSFLGGSYGSRDGLDGCRKHISAGYENKRRELVQIERIAPDLAARALVDKLFTEEEERRQAFGFATVERRYDDASSAETDAALALCSYRCKTADEEKRRALHSQLWVVHRQQSGIFKSAAPVVYRPGGVGINTETEKAPLATNDALEDLANIRGRVRLLELALLGSSKSGMSLEGSTYLDEIIQQASDVANQLDQLVDRMGGKAEATTS